MATKRHIWRPGDKCRVVKPLWVKRVGYPLVWYDLMDEVETDWKVGQAWDVLHGDKPRQLHPTPDQVLFNLRGGRKAATDGVPRYFLQAAAKALVEQRSFGGNERKMIYDEDHHGCQCQPGAVLTVRSKRIVKTGTRFSATAGGSNGYYDWDGEPGGLADMQTHILLMTDCGEIEAANVELVDKTSKV